MKSTIISSFSIAALIAPPPASAAAPVSPQDSFTCAVYALRDVGGKYTFPLPPQISIQTKDGASFQAITKPTKTSLGGLRTFSIAHVDNIIGFMATDKKSLSVALWNDTEKMDVSSWSADNDLVMYTHDVQELKTAYHNCLDHLHAQADAKDLDTTPEMNALRMSLGM